MFEVADVETLGSSFVLKMKMSGSPLKREEFWRAFMPTVRLSGNVEVAGEVVETGAAVGQ